MSNTNIRFSVVHTNKTTLENTVISNGSVYFVEDTKELFYDFGSKRVEVKDILVLSTESERTSILFTPLNKFYFVLETQILWLYKDGSWYKISSDLSNYYTKSEIVSLLSLKQDLIVDTSTVVVDEKGLNALGVLEKNTGNAVFDWIGTLEEWELGRTNGIIPDTYICFITND